MKTLQNVKPTPEQLKLITFLRPGKRIIRGAAGSGKTTTSLLMLKTALGYLLDVFREQSNSPAINVKVFTFNKTLSAYVTDLVSEVSTSLKFLENEINLEVSTLSKYLYRVKPTEKSIIELATQENTLKSLGYSIPLSPDFLVDEVEYLLGRLGPDNFEEYIDLERSGRGSKPRVERQLRRRILDEVVYPYINFKTQSDLLDWNDLAIISSKNKFDNIDLLVIDEAQDFSANQLRAILAQLSLESFTTIVLDSAQKIYKRGFTWKEVGITDATYFRLEFNYRNTLEIADFALGLLQNAGVTLDDDATYLIFVR